MSKHCDRMLGKWRNNNETGDYADSNGSVFARNAVFEERGVSERKQRKRSQVIIDSGSMFEVIRKQQKERQI